MLLKRELATLIPAEIALLCAIVAVHRLILPEVLAIYVVVQAAALIAIWRIGTRRIRSLARSSRGGEQGTVPWSTVGKINLCQLGVISIGTALLPDFSHAGRVAFQSGCYANLNKIALALDNYRRVNGAFPPASRCDTAGGPAHSWRVDLLPYLGEEDLFTAYRFDEPWDSARNLRVARGMPDVYRCPSSRVQSGLETNYLWVLRSKQRDSTSGRGVSSAEGEGTIMIVEVERSGILWTKPEDLRIDEMDFRVNARDRDCICSRHTGGAHVLFDNLEVVFLTDETPVEELQRMLLAERTVSDR